MPKLRHYDDLGTARFVTFSCYKRIPVFHDAIAAEIFVRHLGDLRFRHKVRILGYVVMPDHVHIVLHPPVPLRLGIVIGQMKGRSAREIVQSLEQRSCGILPRMRRMRGDFIYHSVWQHRFYDHNCRTMETVLEKINYCHNNPVARKLVQDPAEWSWSSFPWYLGECRVPLEIDPICPP